MKSFWMNLAVENLEKAGQFYEAVGFSVATLEISSQQPYQKG